MTTNQKEILVHGFIREIKNTSNTNIIIPLGVIQVCCIFFYSIQFKICVSIATLGGYKICIGDIKHKSLSNCLLNFYPFFNIDNHPYQNIKRIPSICYISEISSHIKMDKSNKYYDGLISLCDQEKEENGDYWVSYHPGIALFKSNDIDDENINCNFYVNITETIPDNDEPTNNMRGEDIHLLYIEKQQSVIYKAGNAIPKLYELKLNTIDITSNDADSFNFQYLSDVHPSLIKGYRNISTGCIHNESKIFVIQNMRSQSGYKYKTESKTKIQKRLESGIFDIETKKWNLNKSLEIDLYDNYHDLEFAICQKNVYDTNIVYAVSNNGHTIKYDLEKNNWSIMYEDLDDNKLKFHTKPVVWIGNHPFILCCSSVGSQQYFGLFDIRNNKRGWIQNNDMQFIYNKPFISAAKLFL